MNSDETTCIYPASGLWWPLTADIGAAVTVTYQTGYGAAASVPAPLVEAVKQLAAHWYENREAVLIGVNAQNVPLGLFDLVAPYRRFVF